MIFLVTFVFKLQNYILQRQGIEAIRSNSWNKGCPKRQWAPDEVSDEDCHTELSGDSDVLEVQIMYHQQGRT
jgi:hypothetical protein